MQKIRDIIGNNLLLRQLKYALIFFLSLFLFVSLFLRIYGRHGQAFSVPDLRGLSVSEATDRLNETKLKAQVIDSVFVPGAEKGVVVEQNPGPNFKIKAERTVFLIVNARNPEKVSLPGLSGVTMRQAKAILETRGLRVGRISYVPDIAQNSVISASYGGHKLQPDIKIPKGSAIDLVLGKGLGSETTDIPTLIGLNLQQAQNKITEAYLNTGAVNYDRSVATAMDSLQARIFKQRPETQSGLRASMGAFMDIWLTIDSTKIDLATENND